MNEFWAIVLGAVLATLGGLVGTLFSEHLKKRERTYADQKVAYIKLLEVVGLVNIKGISLADQEQYSEEIYKEIASAQLYASEKVRKCCDKFLGVAYDLESYKNQDLEEIQNEMILQMRADLGIKDRFVLERVFEKKV